MAVVIFRTDLMMRNGKDLNFFLLPWFRIAKDIPKICSGFR